MASEGGRSLVRAIHDPMEEKLQAPINLQLTEDIAQMRLYRFRADPELRGDLFVRFPLNHPLHDLLLPLCQGSLRL